MQSAGEWTESSCIAARFEVRRKLGTGGFGTVYEAFDRERGMPVAIKALKRLDPTSLYQFKQEFRALADLVHPNLVRLHELFALQSGWFFSMDLVEGVPFLDYVRPQTDPSQAETVRSGSASCPETLRSAETPLAPESVHYCSPHLDTEALSRSLEQLVQGVLALHRAGKVHRDIKPLNVLVRPQGTVVLLDFGLVTDLGAEALLDSSVMELIGTPAYMSPEQAEGQIGGPESDWYAVGVMLYEALTGALPFDGSPIQILCSKRVCSPPPIQGATGRKLATLCTLALGLLHPDPRERLTGLDVLQALQRFSPTRLCPCAQTTSPVESLVGRDEALQVLREAFARLQQGSSVFVPVQGASGVGKTALVRRFVQDLHSHHGALVVHGRCFESESVPFKALDSLVDCLTRHLATLSAEQRKGFEDLELGALGRLFPVLQRIWPQLASQVCGERDEQQQRERAFVALSSLLIRLSGRRPLVLWIDDLQWGDLDSVAFFRHLLSQSHSALLVLASFHGAEPNAVLAALSQCACEAVHVRVLPLVLYPLTQTQSEALVHRLLGSPYPAGHPLVRHIAKEAGGNPFFIHEIVSDVRRETEGIEPGNLWLPRVRLQAVLQQRIEMLPQPARHLLEVVCVSGRALPIAVARDAAGLNGKMLDALDELRHGHLVRTQGLRTQDLMESYHDQVRRTVLSLLSARQIRQIHQALAGALERQPECNPETLAHHLLEAGEPRRAWPYLVLAAQKASKALAFCQAALLHHRAVELRDIAKRVPSLPSAEPVGH